MHKPIATAIAVATLALGGAGVLRAEDFLVRDEGLEDAAPEIEYTQCGQGVLNECGSVTQTRCTAWVTVTVSGSLGITGGLNPGGSASGSTTLQCSSQTTTVTKVYKDRFKPKTT